jgi:hypothetical protein
LLAFAFAIIPVTLSGCAGDPPLPELYPLSGSVSRLDRPVTSGGLIFVPEAGDGTNLVVNAAVRSDGTFTARTEYRMSDGPVTFHTGIPAGRYLVVYHPPSDGSRQGLEVELQQRVVVERRETNVNLVLPDEMPAGSGEPRNKPAAPADGGR